MGLVFDSAAPRTPPKAMSDGGR